MAPHGLPPVPSSVLDPEGNPRFGTYFGELAEVSLRAAGSNRLAATALDLFRKKKWAYALLTTPEVVTLVAIVDLGYSATAFVTVVDLHRKLLVFDESFVQLPGPLVEVNDRPARGLKAWFRTAGAELAIEREHGSEHYRIRVDVSRLRRPIAGGLRLDAEVLGEGGPSPIAVVAPVGGRNDTVNVTQKSGGLLASGTLQVGGRRFKLDGGVSGLDYTHGHLARKTAWRWAFAQGRLEDGKTFGLNLVDGFNEDHPDANENALWLGDRLVPLSRARISFNQSDPFDRWRLRTVEGEVDLTFHPIHAHREERNLGLVQSRFIQPAGLFFGSVKAGGDTVALQGIPGVTEDQDVVW
jgi:hypothetical protein